MSRFDTCLRFVLQWEGGFANDPLDRGGATNKGITQSTYDKWCRKYGRQPQSVEFISDDEVAAIYKEQYWREAHCDALPDGLDAFAFDSAVQHSPRRAIKFIQRALGIEDDGVIGPKSAMAIREEVEAGRSEELIYDCLSIRQSYYDAIVAHDSSQSRFHRGWMNRLKALREFIGIGDNG